MRSVVFRMGGPGMFSFVTEAAGRARRMSLTKKAPKKEEKEEVEEGELTHDVLTPSEMKRLRELFDKSDITYTKDTTQPLNFR